MFPQKTKIITLFLLFSLTYLSLFSQNTFEKVWGFSSNEISSNAIQIRNGEYILLGTNEGDGQLVFGASQLLKLDSLGNQIWRKQYFGRGFSWAKKFIQTSDSGFLIVGSTSEFLSNPTFHDVMLLKTDAEGNQEWLVSFDSIDTPPIFSPHEEAFDVIQTRDDNYVLTGIAGGLAAFTGEAFILKVDRFGNLLWLEKDAGLDKAIGRSIIEDEYGNLLIFGNTISSAENQLIMYLSKHSSDGKKLWGKTYRREDLSSEGQSVKIDKNGDYLLLGSTYSDSSTQMFLIKTDTSGNTIWKNNYNAFGNSQGLDICITENNQYALIGRTSEVENGNQDVYLVVANSSGEIAWEKAYNASNSELGQSIVQTIDNGFLLAATTSSNTFGIIHNDYFLIKTNCNGFVGEIKLIEEKNNLYETCTFPNPFTNYTTIKLNEQLYCNLYNAKIELKIFDAIGKEYSVSYALVGNGVLLHRGPLQRGAYIYQLFIDKQFVSTGKVFAF